MKGRDPYQGSRVRDFGNSTFGKCLGAALIIIAVLIGMSQLITACGGPAVMCGMNSNLYDDAQHKCTAGPDN